MSFGAICQRLSGKVEQMFGRQEGKPRRLLSQSPENVLLDGLFPRLPRGGVTRDEIANGSLRILQRIDLFARRFQPMLEGVAVDPGLKLWISFASENRIEKVDEGFDVPNRRRMFAGP